MYGRGRPTSSRDKLIAFMSFVVCQTTVKVWRASKNVPHKKHYLSPMCGDFFLGELCSKEREIRSQFTEGISYLMVVMCCPVCCHSLFSNDFCMFINNFCRLFLCIFWLSTHHHYFSYIPDKRWLCDASLAENQMLFCNTLLLLSSSSRRAKVEYHVNAAMELFLLLVPVRPD